MHKVGNQELQASVNVLITTYKTPDGGLAVVTQGKASPAAARNSKILDAVELPSLALRFFLGLYTSHVCIFPLEASSRGIKKDWKYWITK